MTDEKNNHTTLKIISGIIIVVLIAGFAARNTIKGYLKEKAASVIVEKLLDEKIANDKKMSGVTAEELYDRMDVKDKQKVMDIITGNMTEENLKQVNFYLTNGDMSGLKQYVKGRLSSEDKATVQELYEKYKSLVKQ